MDFALLSQIDWPEIGTATLDTLLMLGGSLLFTILLGLPLGIVLFLTAKGQLLANATINRALGLVVNVLRSIPFIILLIALMPVTEFITGTRIGLAGIIPPLVIGASPFLARLVETALREVEHGVIEAALAMGANTRQILFGVLLPEARGGLIAGITVTAITLVSYTAMAGLVGGGGLGDLSIRYGYYRYQTEVMVVTIILLLLLVQALQSAGDRLVQRCTHK
ncbi:methionine ABC transporter permease [Chitinilyticum litopenaei]|uniref:methionine ABC transporter permease n=1 Tax=Chitinilyticum litopenaei TaxID=1121276 RepID=UPI0004113F59|nr:methionine ABC transporter permease [Chitinilyticum litopenaei]